MWLIELAAAVYLGRVLWPYVKRLTVPRWVHNAAIALFWFVLVITSLMRLFSVP